jgi:hypothetical protein
MRRALVLVLLVSACHRTAGPATGITRGRSLPSPPGALRALALGAVNVGCDPVDYSPAGLEATCAGVRLSIAPEGDQLVYGCAPPTDDATCRMRLDELMVEGREEAGVDLVDEAPAGAPRLMFKIVDIHVDDQVLHPSKDEWVGQVCDSDSLTDSSVGAPWKAGKARCPDAPNTDPYFRAVLIAPFVP